MARRQHKRAKSAKDFRRRAATQIERDRVLIVTEGSKTEPDYFKLLIAELGLTTAKVQIAGDGGSAAASVVEHAEYLLSKDDDFEQIYMVFDRDDLDNYNAALAKVAGLAARRKFKAKTIAAITSVPCFEIWFMMHVTADRKPYDAPKSGTSPATMLIADLKKHEPFTGYEKASCDAFYADITPHRDAAKTRARRTLEQGRKSGEKEYHENPSTRVYIVVEALEKLSKQ